ncbi:MAG TPA: hypothetical protein VFK88_06705 [Gallionella sp.]|nr:hypothetical protein [Gallionella sp.]
MGRIYALLVSMVLLLPAAAPAEQQATVRIRGTVAAVAGNELQVKTREGNDLKLDMTDSTKVNVLKPIKMEDIKEGSFVGVTAIQTGPGTPLLAREVHLFPEVQRGTGEGHREWDLEPGSSMTNANVDAIVSTNNGKELKLSYKGGRQQIVVPQGIPLVTFRSGDKSLLKAGVKVFIIAQKAADGRLVAQHIQVGKDGIAPPM